MYAIRSYYGVPVTPPARGRFRLEECRLESLFPLSTVRFVLALTDECTAVVYPAPHGKPLSQFIAEHTSHIGEERDFEGLSAYSGSEPPSRIHWASVAKGEEQVKKFEKLTVDDRITSYNVCYTKLLRSYLYRRNHRQGRASKLL